MVLSAISLDLFAVLFGGAVALIPAFTDKVLHLGPEAYGFLRTAPAIGAVLILNEILSASIVVGGLLIIGAVLISELKPFKKKPIKT